jgi:hypothetical protein
MPKVNLVIAKTNLFQPWFIKFLGTRLQKVIGGLSLHLHF